MKRIVPPVVVALAASVAHGQLAEVGEPEGQVSIVAWPGYIERGETDPNSTG